MRTLFTGLLGAGLVFATPTQAKFIATNFYMPNVMLEMCKSEIAQGQAGFCTGYVIATWEQLAGASQVCQPPGVEYEDMLRAVVRRFEEGSGWMRPGDTDLQVRVALKNAWPCKK
jgi:Rap1a immunity proteins